MRIFSGLYIFIFCFLFSYTLNAQLPIDVSMYSARQIKRLANDFEIKGDVYTASSYYEIYCDRKEKDIDAQYKLAELYRLSRDYGKAAKIYEKVYNIDPDKYILALYWASLMLIHESKFKEAADGLNKFIIKYKGNEADRFYKKMAPVYLEGALNAQNKIDSAKAISVTHLNNTINKGSIEFSPMPIANNKIIYGSMRIDSVKYYEYYPDNISEENKPPVRKLYVAEKSNSEWKYKGEFDSMINDSTTYTGNAVFSPDGKHIYFTKCGEAKGSYICNLYMSARQDDGSWGEPVKLPEPVNSDKYTSTQPTLGYDFERENEILYFVSDMEGGRGGLDIWYTSYNPKTNEWKNPKNAGNMINSMADEITPYYDLETKTMYFSSNSYPGIGGFDVFKATGELREWMEFENMGAPINSEDDDMYYVPGKDKNDGFFVSNRDDSYTFRNKNCCDDIYYFKWNDYIFVGVEGKVYDIPDNEIMELLNRKFNLGIELFREKRFLPNIPVQLFCKNVNTDEYLELISVKTDSSGRFFFNVRPGKDYYVQVTNYGYFDKRKNFSTMEIKDSDTLDIHEIGINYIPNKPMKLNVYYEFDKAVLTDSSRLFIDTTLLEVMRKLPQITIEVSSHTDSCGSERYNNYLSQRRAESVVNYLIGKGIKKERMIAKGYGESMPIAPNTNPDGTDNPEGRAINRRSEIRILKTLKELSEEDE